MSTDSSAPAWPLVVLMVLFAWGCRPRTQDISGEPPKPAARASIDLSAELQRVQSDIKRRNYVAAKLRLDPLLVTHSHSAECLELAGELAEAQNSQSQAASYYQSAIDLSAKPPKEWLDRLGRLRMKQGLPFDALSVLERLVHEYPDAVDARVDLAGLLDSLALEHRAAIHLRKIIEQGRGGVEELIVLSDLNRPQTDRSICDYALKNQPNDSRPQYPLARIDAYDAKWSQVANQLDAVWRQYPEFAEASALYGRVLTEVGDEEKQSRWRASLPDTIQQQPLYWLTLGIQAERASQPLQAAAAYWQSLQLDPDNGETLSRMAAVLATRTQPQLLQSLRQRAATLSELRASVDSLIGHHKNSQRAALEIAQSLRKLDRPTEAERWSQLALTMTNDLSPLAAQVAHKPKAELATPNSDQSQSQDSPSLLSPSQLQWLAEVHPRLPELPTPQWQQADNAIADANSDSPRAVYSFVNEAQQRGVDHICQIGSTADGEAGLWIFQSGAGGVGVLDFDLDGMPDLYLTQCNGKPLHQDSAPNQLYRNLDARFTQVTQLANCGDRGFSLGVACGDFDNDGFTDIVVANYGINHLYRNQGDGTFTNVTDAVGLDTNDYSTSLALADLNGDGIADLFEANYLSGDAVLTQPCYEEKSTTPRSCNPLVFPAAADHVWEGTADGRYVRRDESWLAAAAPGRGLGIAVGSFDNQPGNDVYVANDMTANHFWSSESLENGYHMNEQAVPRGLALNERSLAQASMGIAAGDCDGDLDIDFYLGHFFDDYNTLYLQESPGLWSDRTAAAALVEPTMSMLAYGTQWIDADLDGQLELVVANGHIDDFSSKGRPYRMPMQFFERNPQGQYHLVRDSAGEPLFPKPQLSRAVALADINRDRLPDIVVTHLFEPVSLWINRVQSPIADASQLAANGLTVRLAGTHSQRDAIGAYVDVWTSEDPSKRPIRRFVTAGDGYQCSNERVLTFGLGPSRSPIKMQVTWPDGKQSAIASVAPSTDWLWIEGDTEPWSLSR